MTWASVNSSLNFWDFTSSQESLIRAALKAAYANSKTAAAILEKIPASKKKLEIQYKPGVAQAYAGEFEVFIDLDYVPKILLINQEGRVFQADGVSTLMHEIIHAVEGLLDTPRDTNTKSAGPTVERVNRIRAELGDENLRVSYEGAGREASLELNKEYSGGKKIDLALLSKGRRDTSKNSQSTSDLLIGIRGYDNQFFAGGGPDFLWGQDGNDQLNGGGGDDIIEGGIDDDMAIYRGNRDDYIINEIMSDSSSVWSIRDTQSSRDGTDSLRDVEILRFADGDIRLHSGEPAARIGQNLVLVVDTSTSMDDDIDEVKKLGTELINKLFGTDTNPIDSHFAIVDFNDTPTSSPILTQLFFTKQKSITERKNAALTALNQLKVRGGGEEPMYQAIIHAATQVNQDDFGNVMINSGWPRAGSNRMVIMTDEPPADPEFRERALYFSQNIHDIYTERWTGTTNKTNSTPAGFAFDYDLDEPLSYTAVTSKASIFPVLIGSDEEGLNAAKDLANSTGGQVLQANNAAEAARAVLDAVTAPVGTQVTLQSNTYNVPGQTSQLVDSLLSTNQEYLDLNGTSIDVKTSSWSSNYFLNRVSKAQEYSGEEFKYAEARQLDVDISKLPVTQSVDIAGSILVGSTNSDILEGRAGWDIIDAFDGDDLVHGGNGRDIISGGGGSDELHGDFGLNTFLSEKDGSIDLIAIKSDQFLNNWWYGTSGNSPNGEKADIIEGLDSNDIIVIIGAATYDLSFKSDVSHRGVSGVGIYAQGVLEALYIGGDLTASQISEMTLGDASSQAMANEIYSYWGI